MGSGISNIWFPNTPYLQMTRYGACAVPILLSKWPMQITYLPFTGHDQLTVTKFNG